MSNIKLVQIDGPEQGFWIAGAGARGEGIEKPSEWLRAELQKRDFRIEETDDFYHCRKGRAPERLLRISIDKEDQTTEIKFQSYQSWEFTGIHLTTVPRDVILALVNAAEEKV